MIRTVLFWLHLTAGVLAGAIILIMSVTGVLLTYEKQMTYWADTKQLVTLNAPATKHLSADSLVSLAKSAKPGKTPSAITLRADTTQPAQVSFGQDGVIYLDPTTGAVLGTGNAAMRGFFRSMTSWHRWLAVEGPNRGMFRSVTGAANLLFLILVLTGMVLWLPKTWSWIKVRAVLWFRSGLSGKARDFNWHNVLGIWSAVPLIAIVASGVVISYPWAGDLVYRIAGEAPPPRNAGGPPGGAGPERGPSGPSGSGEPQMRVGKPAAQQAATPAPSTTYAAMIATASTLMPEWRAVTLQVPKDGAKTVSVSLDKGTGGQPQLRSTVQLSSSDGSVAKYQPFDSLSPGRQARNVLRFTHTGEVLGLFGQTIAGLVSLASVVLVVTGIMLSIRRASRAIARRNNPRASAGAVTAPTS